MMKRKFLAVVLPIIGCATVVGSGFSAWYFGEVTGVKNSSFQLGIDVSEEVDASDSLNISVSKNLANKKVMLDQGGQNNKDLNSGISIVNSDVSATTFNIADHVEEISDVYYEFTVEYTGTNTSLSQIYSAGMKINVSVTIDFIGESLIKYIGLQDNLALTVMTSNPENTAESKKFTPTEESVSVDAADSFVASIDITNPGDDIDDGQWTFRLGMSTTLTQGNYRNEFLKYQTSSGDGPNSVGKPNASGEPEFMRDKLASEHARIDISTVATLA